MECDHKIIWKAQTRRASQWKTKKIFKATTVGKHYTIHPNEDECFFLHTLVKVPEPTPLPCLSNGITHSTLNTACHTLNLLENLRHWELCFRDSCNTSHTNQIHVLFAIYWPLALDHLQQSCGRNRFRTWLKIVSVEYAGKVQIWTWILHQKSGIKYW